MKRYKTTIKDRLFPHHTEEDSFKIELVFGKDHTHLEIKESISRSFISKDKNELIDYAIALLKKYKKTPSKKNENK